VSGERRGGDGRYRTARVGDMILIKTLLYTGVRVAELVAIGIDDVDLDACRIRITHGKGGKDRVGPFPQTFHETLGHASRQSLEIYSRLALSDAQASYDQAIARFPV
jgi:site-specific recombinase XerC